MMPCISQQMDLTAFNTFGFAAKASNYISVQDSEQFIKWWCAPEQSAVRSQKRFILGGGSNLVLTQDVDAWVIHLQSRGITEVNRDAIHVWLDVAAGEVWHDWVMYTVAQNWAGIENLALISGTVGASPVQNIGAYGMEAGQAIESVTVFDFATLNTVLLSAQDCAFAYRDSVFKHELHAGQARYLITSVRFKLRHQLNDWQASLGYGDVAACAQENMSRRAGEHITPQDVAQAVISIRQSKLPDPAVLGNAGSFFKNPVVSAVQAEQLKLKYATLPSYPMVDGQMKLAAGWLIEQAGWKGHRSQSGCVGVYEKQALVLVNHGCGTGAELMQFASAIAQDVHRIFGVKIESEPIVL